MMKYLEKKKYIIYLKNTKNRKFIQNIREKKMGFIFKWYFFRGKHVEKKSFAEKKIIKKISD